MLYILLVGFKRKGKERFGASFESQILNCASWTFVTPRFVIHGVGYNPYNLQVIST